MKIWYNKSIIFLMFKNILIHKNLNLKVWSQNKKFNSKIKIPREKM